MKRIIAFVLSVVMLISVIPAQQLFAAGTAEEHYFALDTDGIDEGADYLIVSEKKDGVAYALQKGNTSVKEVTISDKTISSFDDAACIWTFDGAENGTVTNDSDYLDIQHGISFSPEKSILNFADFSAGVYGIYLEDATSHSLHYLRYDGSNWIEEVNSDAGASGNNMGSYKSCVYLFKKITFQNISYHGNGHTAGELPEGQTKVKTGTKYLVEQPVDGFLKVDGEKTYLFVGWNTEADGSGVTYYPGDTLTVGYEDIVLYAKWQLQAQYMISVVTNLDNVPTDMELIDESVDGIYVSFDESPKKDTQYIELSNSGTGIYTVTVHENGIYYVYFKNAQDEYEQVHGHQVVIYNQNGNTILQHYSVTYQTGLTEGQEGTATWKEIFHANTTPLVTDVIPKKSGYVFAGWKSAEGNVLVKGEAITSAITQPIVLTAQWVEATTVTVNITIDHKGLSEGEDNSDEKSEITFQLLQEKNGVNLPLDGSLITLQGVEDEENHVSSISYVFEDMEKGDGITYHVSTEKRGYEVVDIETTRGNAGEYIINVKYQYAPTNFDLAFDVKMAEGTPKGLYPKAVNVKVSYWGFNDDEVLGWHIITQQDEDAVPYTVSINQDGEGSGYYSVWEHWSDVAEPYLYRIEVTSYVLPDGRVVAATSEDKVTYVSQEKENGLYNGVVTIKEYEGGPGRKPDYPEESNTLLEGAYINGDSQAGIPTLTIKAEGYRVTFHAGDHGKIEGTQILNLGDQYQYPNLNTYVPVADNPAYIFDGWYIDDTKAENQAGEYLTTDVTYTAKWREPRIVSGVVYIDTTYQLDGQERPILERDCATSAVAVLQKKVNNTYNDYASMTITNFIPYGNQDMQVYTFSVPNDDSNYRIQILMLNYTGEYDNNNDSKYSKEEYDIIFNGNRGGVSVHFAFTPDSYKQVSQVDASQISKEYRPTEVFAKIIYRDLGVSGSDYDVVSQHHAEEDGMQMAFNASGEAFSEYSIWKWHTDGMLYEYQLKLFKLYGNVSGVFAQDGSIAYDSQKSPYTIKYGQTAWWDNELEGAPAIKATLIPNKYEIKFDLNLGEGSDETILGMEEFVTDDGNEGHYYSYAHTWSYGDKLTAFPFRAGYVFEGWTTETEGVYINNGGYVTVGAGLAENVVLKAKWKKLEGDCYVVRYLEKNTERVLCGAKVVEDAKVGDRIKPHDEAQEISGYRYAGFMLEGTYYEKESTQEMIIKGGTSNILTIYYIPSDDGYTDQVESNLHLDKTATLVDDGTYTITMETYTKDNPVTTQILQNTPLDIVLVIDQSGSIIQNNYLNELQGAVDNFINLIAEHGRENEVDHRIAMVGYAGDYDEPPTSTNTSQYPIAGGNTSNWVNTGVFDSNGDFHPYTTTGFNYKAYTGNIEEDGTYYVKSNDKYLLLMYHDTYYHLITEEQARIETAEGTTVYGYINGNFEKLSRNHSGLWIYGDNQLYSLKDYFTYHEKVWTHRDGLGQRQIHAYGVGADYICTDGHSGLYQRTVSTASSPQLNVYEDALIPVSVEENGAGRVNPNLIGASQRLGSNGGTYVQYGIEMANRVFEANKATSAGRVQIMIMFTDGLPGIGTFDANEANAAIDKAYTTKNTYGAYCYTIGLYPSDGVDSTSDVSIYMNALSSNYPQAKKMEDIYVEGSYYLAEKGTNINDGRTYYVRERKGWFGSSYNYYPLSYGTVRVGLSNRTGWYYTKNGSNVMVTTTREATVGNSSEIGGYTICGKNEGYVSTPHSGYYSTTDSENELRDYFANVVTEITTKITREIILHTDTIIRDIMGQGLVLTKDTVINAYRQAGTYNLGTGGIDWKVDSDGKPVLESVATLEMSTGTTKSDETVQINGQDVSYIQVYNMGEENTTNPKEDNYHPHTVDITGYDFEDWYISDTHPQGYKMVVTISRVEARDDVVWGRSTETNNEQSGLWLPADEKGNRELLLAFEQPKTIFVQRSYVLDYAKKFDLKEWYFDKIEGNEKVGPIHLDTNIENGMNWFDKENPTVSSGRELDYANASIQEQVVSYTPTNMNWNDVQEFYVFGNTEKSTVTTQDANQNGNLWTKVNVLPANSIYYEDTFVTTEGSDVKGFKYTGTWETVYSGNKDAADKNTETPEHQEDSQYGDVHGWIDSMRDDEKFSDGSAHYVGEAGMGASVEFTFTGVGVDIYTRTNVKSGMVVATLSKIEGNTVTTKSAQMVDNLAVSGDYYHIPTISFKNLAYGTYKVKIFATAASDVATGVKRYEYYLDGIRVYSPLGENQVNASDIIKDAYGKEQNAVFTEVRDILLEYNDFNIDMNDSEDKKAGAVFIDTIKEGQGSGADEEKVETSTYEVGTFKAYGPKNEVYLKGGQSIVLKVDKDNTYYVGLKSLDGKTVSVNVSGISKAQPQTIQVSHSIDMYYEVTPIEGYIVIENASTGDEILSLTKLRTTNLAEHVTDGGVLPVTKQEAVMMMARFALRMNPPVYEEPEEIEPEKTETEKPKTDINSPDENAIKDMIVGLGNTSTEEAFSVQQNNDVPSEKSPTTSQTTEEKMIVDTSGTQEYINQKPKETLEDEPDDVQENLEEDEKIKVGFWRKILEFLKKLFSFVVSGISNLIGGENS